MDNNQPPANPADTQPTPTLEPTQAPESTPSPTEATPVTDPAPTPTKKKHKGLIITLICLFVALLIGGGAFAAAYIINNQPANIIMSALGNFFSAEQVEVNGSVDLALQNSEELGIESLSINFDDKAVGLSNNTTATLNVNFANGASAPAIELGEVMLNNGVLYIEASGLKDFYDQAFRDNVKNTLIDQVLYSQTTTVNDCLVIDGTGGYVACSETTTIAVDPATEAAVSQAIDQILDQVGEIINTIDGQWIEISIDDVMNSEMFTTAMPSSTRNSISDAYKCTANTLNQISSYSGEFSDLYSQNPFINMTAGADSFYDISFDTAKLTNYFNAMAKTKFANDLTTCYGSTLTKYNTDISAENVADMLEYVPKISAKFDGFFNHHLTELKMMGQNGQYTLTSDLKFSYPKNITVTAPANSRPVMDVVDEVSQGLEVLESLFTL